ncbi:glycosyltransferase BC10-like [Apium graveolens]|uniref:glycosyltransferase BC10-like n=1 Tax=Apium graveolens TaxID=4045 RepID=UPI003D78C466
MKHNDNPLKLHSQMNLHSFIIHFFVFCSGFIIGITLNLSFSNTDVPFHSHFTQFSSAISSPPSSTSRNVADDTKIVTENESKESTQLPETMHIESNGTQNDDSRESSEMPETVNIEQKGSQDNGSTESIEMPETVIIEQKDTQNNDLRESSEMPATVITQNNDSKESSALPGTMPIEQNDTQNNTSLDYDRYPNRIQEMHHLSDYALISRALSVDHETDQNEIVPKVAFMFLTRGNLHLAPLWDLFFKGHEGLYSVYVHTQPTFNGTFPENSVFHGRRIPSKRVEWGKFNMIEAEKRLLASALLDTSNQRFVLLSESCIPLFNFTTIYSYLINSTETFVEAYDLPGPVGQGRYNPRMKPEITLEQWRKGSQWFQMDRELALEIISDQKYMALFKRFCKPACYSDEHYIPTFVNMKFWEKNSNRTLTWVDWTMGGPHPTRFGRMQVTVELLKGMRSGKKCLYNGEETNVCSLFARKFLPNAVDRLLKLAPKVMKF